MSATPNAVTWPGSLFDGDNHPYEEEEAAALARHNERAAQPDKDIRRWASTVSCGLLRIAMLELAVSGYLAAYDAFTESASRNPDFMTDAAGERMNEALAYLRTLTEGTT